MKPWNPHAYQKRAVKFLVERAAAALLLDPGLGKTSVTYAALKVLKRVGMLEGALVVAPRRVTVSVWPQEQQEWSDFRDLKVVVLYGDRKERLVQQENVDVWVLNFEGLKWFVNNGHMARLLNTKKLDVLIIDELSKVKHVDSARHKFLASWHHRFARRWGLTGSPASNGLIDLFGEIYMLDLGAALGKFFTAFRWNFFEPSNPRADYPVWVPKKGAEPTIYNLLKPVALRISSKGRVKMPELVPPIPMKFELDSKTRMIYDAMEQEFFSVLDDAKRKGKKELITASTAAASAMKCRQIATGAVYEDLVDPLTGIPKSGMRKWHKLHDFKMEAFEDLVEELQGQQLMAGYYFGHDMERMLKWLLECEADPDFEVPVIAGGTSDKKALRYEEEWNANKHRVGIFHPSSVGHGLNFQKGGAHHIFFYSLTYNYEEYDQYIRRLMRQGNPAAQLLVHIPMAIDTVEEAIWASLNNKRRTQDALHVALEEYRERRGL